jgi:hypothetical protein
MVAAGGSDWTKVRTAKVVKATSAVKAAFATAAAKAGAAARREAVALGDVALHAEGYTGAKTGYLGIFERQEEMVEERPTYKKPGKKEFLFYSSDGSWLVGADTSKADGWWKVESTATTPGAITETWQVGLVAGRAGGLLRTRIITWPRVPAAKVVKRAVFEAVVLHAKDYAGKWAYQLGMFELQEDMVEGRPTYKQPGKELFLFYSTNGMWVVGPDTSKTGLWLVKSAATTPGAITETWTAWDSDKKAMVEVPSLKVMSQVAFEAGIHRE